jgi:branched-chain amino acid transport system substrate-binding protein
LQGAKLAAEQINAEGGLLGRQIEVIGEDSNLEGGGSDPVIFNTAITKLLTVHKVDFIIGMAADQGFTIQENIAQHKKIFFDIDTTQDTYTQRVLDDYDHYKYYFRVTFNATSVFQGIIDGLLHFKELTGLTKIGYLAEDLGWNKDVIEALDVVLPKLGFDLVYKGKFPPFTTIDFSSYFAAAEAAGVEVLMPLIAAGNGIAFMKEFHDRQSPMIISGGSSGASTPEGWIITDGKCEYISVVSSAVDAAYPLTSKTLPFREAYLERWNEIASGTAACGYNILRFILTDAIMRAGTLEVNAVIYALETTSVETTNAKNFVFTESHDPMMGENPNDPEADYPMVMVFQWQNGLMVPIYPKKIMEEAGASYMFPDWPGPWDNIS